MANTKGGTAGLTAVLACALALSGCVAGKMHLKSPADEAKSKGKPAAESEKPYAPGVEVTEASLRGSEFTSVPELVTIHFDYDSATLDATALAALKENAEYLKAHDDLDIRVAGYCDERGTVE